MSDMVVNSATLLVICSQGSSNISEKPQMNFQVTINYIINYLVYNSKKYELNKKDL